MKISPFICIFISTLLFQGFAHKHHNHHASAHDHSSEVEGHHHHHHSHDSHENHSHHSHEETVKHSDHTYRTSFIEDFLSSYFPNISQSKVIMMTIAVVIISIPSLPTFLVLLSISKLNPNKPNNGQVLNEKYLRWMICLAVGSLTGDVFFGMMEHIMNCKTLISLIFII